MDGGIFDDPDISMRQAIQDIFRGRRTGTVRTDTCRL